MQINTFSNISNVPYYPNKESRYTIFLNRLFKVFTYNELKDAFYHDIINNGSKYYFFQKMRYRKSISSEFIEMSGLAVSQQQLIDFMFENIKTKDTLFKFVSKQMLSLQGDQILIRHIPKVLREKITKLQTTKLKALEGLPRDIKHTIIANNNTNILMKKFHNDETQYGQKKWKRNTKQRLVRF